MTGLGRRTALVAPLTRDDERGMTLIVVLLAVVVIATVFSAILGFQSTALTAQTVLATKRSNNLGADAALDDAIAQLQVSRATGASGGLACNSTTPARLTTWVDPTAGNIDVNCNMQSASSGTGASPRAVHLAASLAGTTIATADVTLYDPPSAAQPTVVSITSWNRAQ